MVGKLKSVLKTPVPTQELPDIVSSTLKFILFFAVFYFAIFKFNAPYEEIYQGVIEFFMVSVSLFCSILIFWFMSELFSKVVKRKLSPNFGTYPLVFLFVYSVGLAILYPMKQNFWNIDKSWIWKYYWRHLPYAAVIFAVFAYREYKNAVIEELVEELNTTFDENENTEIKQSPCIQNDTPLKLQVDGRNHTVFPSKISHISVKGHYLDLYHQKGSTFEQLCIRKPLKEIIEELPKGFFLKIHRSHLINLNFVSHLKKASRQYAVELCDNQFSLPISRSNLPLVLLRLEARL